MPELKFCLPLLLPVKWERKWPIKWRYWILFTAAPQLAPQCFCEVASRSSERIISSSSSSIVSRVWSSRKLSRMDSNWSSCLLEVCCQIADWGAREQKSHQQLAIWPPDKLFLFSLSLTIIVVVEANLLVVIFLASKQTGEKGSKELQQQQLLLLLLLLCIVVCLWAWFLF